MKKIIQNIRKQPEEVRMHILHITTLAFAVILVLLWVYSLGTNLTNGDTQAKIGQDLEPFSALKDDMVGGYKSISNSSNTNLNGDATIDTSSNLSPTVDSNSQDTDTNTDYNTTDSNSSGTDTNTDNSTDSNSDLRTQENNL